MSINDAKWTVAPAVLASSITCFLLLTFVRFHAEIFSNFSHSFSTACFCSRNFHGLRHRNTFVNQIVCCNEFSPFPAIWSSWFCGIECPIRSLVDSLASRMHASFVWILLDAPLPQFFMILQGIAGATDVSNFLRAFLMVSLNSLSSGSMK